MQINYLKNLQKFIEEKKWRREVWGIDEEEITRTEGHYGVRFPQAYREFLWLTGKDFQGWPESHSLDYLLRKSIPENIPSILKEYGVELPKDNYWVIAIENGTIDFFYFDEGENPPVYVCEYEEKEDIKNYLRKVSNTFKEFIDKRIYYADKY